MPPFSRLFPSPPRLPIIGNYLQLGTLSHRSFQSLSQKYGPLMMLHLGQLPVLVVSSIHMAKEVMQTHGIVFANRPSTTLTKALFYGGKDIAFSSYGHTWRQKKKLCVNELLSQKRVQSVQFIREDVNLSEMLIETTNKMICRCIFGRKYDDEGYRLGELGRRITSQVGLMFSLAKLKKIKDSSEEMDDFLDRVIVEHKMSRRDPKKKDFLDILLQLQDDGLTEFELTQNDLKALLMNMFLGGSDTTSTTLEWAMAACKKSSHNEEKDSDVNQMEYMKCVIRETLRMHPAGPLLAPRETTSSVKLGGYGIPDKTTVYINAWVIQRDPEFWEMPEDFLPERFENNKVNFNGQNFQFIPFGSGKRKCPGMAFGLATTEYMLANLLYWFDWKFTYK
ncbi:cytochrome P450 family 71 protein [Medicago truncatula]|uniref:Cytochrome P450 family 71 protein n=2 Tax=Medicago truncatula TaxID=3880 RepID=G7J4W5_MEDTR|nr:cytochrome P450 family 71 protein [Medicago truncatula]